MSPHLLGLPAYPLLLVGGALLAWTLIALRARTLGYAPAALLGWLVVSLPVSALGGKLLALVVEQSCALLKGAEVPLAASGMSAIGATLVGLVYLRWMVARLGPPADVLLDAMAFALPLTTFFGRGGCLLLGCCFGDVAAEDAWEGATLALADYHAASPARIFHGSAQASVRIWNLPGLLMLESALALVLVEWLYRRKRDQAYPPGTWLALAYLLDGLARLTVEPLRGGPFSKDLSPWLWLSAAYATFGFAWLMRCLRVAPRNRTTRAPAVVQH